MHVLKLQTQIITLQKTFSLVTYFYVTDKTTHYLGLKAKLTENYIAINTFSMLYLHYVSSYKPNIFSE